MLGIVGGLLATLALLALAAPASAAPPVCADLALDDVHVGGSVSGQIACDDADGDQLNFQVGTSPAHGFAGVDGAGFVTYFAAFDYAGPDPFTVTVDDGTGGTDTVQVSVEVTNAAPTCAPVDLGSAPHGPFAAMFGVADCEDPDGDAFSDYEIVSQPEHGQATAQFGSLTYDPADDYVGTDSFAYRARDGVAWSEPATVTVELTNAAPMCTQAPTLTIRRDKPASAQVQCFDQENDPLELIVVDPPAHGEITAAPGPFNSLVATYDPDNGYVGTDHMRLGVSDGFEESDAFDVDLNITPNHAPECHPFTTHARVAEPTTVFTSSACFDVDFQDAGDLTVELDPAAGPEHGELVPAGDEYTYTSDAGYTGPDGIGLTASDGDLTTHTTMRLHVADTAYCSPAPTVRLRPGRGKNVDVDCTAPDFGFVTPTLVTSPAKGTVTQSFGEFFYTAGQSASGADAFTFKAGTDELESPVATQDVLIDAAVNEPPECNDQNALPAYPARDAFIFPFCFDPDQDQLTYSVTRAPEHGTARTEFGSIIYKADAGYTGADDLEITVNDGHGAVVAFTQLIDVRQPLAPACAPVQPITVRPGGRRSVILSCTNPQGDPQSYAIQAQGQKGTVTAGDFPGQFRYTADAGASGSDQFVVRVSNAVGATDVPVDVTLDEAWNTAPTCNSFIPVTVARGTTIDLPLASRCTDEEGDAITFTRVTEPQHGSVSPGPAATLQYTADPDFVGFDAFTYKPTDSRGLDGFEASLTLNVVASLDPTCTPLAAVSVRPGRSRPLTLNCQDPGNAPLTYEIVQAPAKGSLSPSGDSASPFRTYTANAGASGADEFTYRASSAGGTSETYTQAITIDPDANAAPTCVPNGAFPDPVPAGRAEQVTPFCSDLDLDPLTYQHVTQPQHGTVTTANGVMTYTPAAGYTGPDEFTYTVSDGREVVGPNTFNLQVVPVVPPTCQEPPPIQVRPTGPPRSVPVLCTDVISESFVIVIDEEPEHGSVTLPGGFPFYDADDGYTGPDSFSYHAENENGASETVTQEITVDPDANTAPECFSGFVKAKPGVARQVTPPCFDADGDALSFEIASQPEHGAVSPQSGTGSITYTADEDYTGPDSFTVAVDDGHGGEDTGTVNVNVTTENTPPSCFSSMQISAQSGSPTLLPAPPCSDQDGDPLTFEIVDEPAHGTITEQNGARFYTADAGYTGPDSFTFRANDGQADSNVATVNVTVGPPPGPVCQPRSYSVPADGTVDIDLDCFAGGQDVQLAIQTPPPAEAGSLGAIDQDGDRVRFTPNPDFRGPTTFTFVGSAGGQTSAPATITITVTARGFPPSVGLTQSTFSPRTGAPVTFTATASDPDGGAIAGYRWFVDDVELPGETTSTLSRSFVTAGVHTVRVRVSDDEGDVTERVTSITAHEGNLAPDVWLDVPSKAGTGVSVRMTAWAWDPEGAIASYSWDFGDGTAPQEGAALRDVTHTYATPGAKTVALTVTDDEGASVTKQATIEITDANTAPELELFVWPEPALRGQAATLFTNAFDAEGDQIAAVDWDLDGDGTYETDGGTAQQLRHTFAEAGDFPIGVRVEDERGATATDEITVHVVNAPPQARIAGPSVIDLGGTGTYTDASTDDGSIVSRAWDTDDDGVFDDGSGPSVQVPAGDETGFKVLRLRVTDDEGETATATRQVTVRPAGPVVISDPVPPPLPGGGTVNIGTVTDPTSGSTTITIPSGQVGRFPNGCMPLDIDVTIRKAAGATVLNPVLVLTTPGGNAERFPMTDADGDGTWTAHLDCAVAGTLKVEYTIKAPDGSEEDFEIPVGKIVLIDPQGVVHDRAAYEAYRAAHAEATADEARAATAIAGATVHLQRLMGGEWKDVNASDPGIDPNENPQITGANGLYKWDVSDGTYRVRVSAPGFRSKTSDPVVIPPPVLDLHIGLDRNPVPVAAIDAADEAFRGQTVTFTSDSSDDGSIAAQRWDLDDDGDFDDGTGAVASRSFTSLGAKTVRLQVTDDEGAKSVVEHVVTIQNRNPTVTAPDGPAEGFRGQELTFTATGADADPGAGPTLTWDADGDGFDDGTGTSVKLSFATLGEKTVRVRATDADGGTAEAQDTVMIVNRKPTVSITEGPATGFRGQSLTFKAEGADADPGAAAPTLTWDTDDDGQFDDGTGSTVSATFATLGAKTIKVKAVDADGGSAEAQRSVTIANRAPQCDAVSRRTAVGAAVSVPLSCTDADGDALTLSKVADPAHGSLGAVAGDAITYTPSAGYFGPDSFTYRASDGTDDSAPATVSITVTRAPACDAISRRTAVGTAVSVPLRCTDADGDALTLSIDSQPGHGTLGAIVANAVTYTPEAGYFGPDSFTYRASDGTAQSAPATVSLTVTRAPSCDAVSKSTPSGTAVEVTLSCSDPDGDALTLSKASDPAHGTIGAIAGGKVTYTPAAGYKGADSFSYRASDGTAQSAPATVSLTVTNRGPSCDAVSASTPSGAPVEVALDCDDPENDALTFTVTEAPEHGTLGAIAGGKVTYTPAAGYTGADSFAYKASDGSVESAPATVSLTVKPKPDTGGGTGGGSTGGGSTGGGSTGGGSTGGGTPPDTKAPVPAVALAKGQKLKKALAKGLKLGLTLDEACAVTVTLSVDKKTARKLKLDKKAKKAVVVGKLTKALAAGKSTVTVKFTAKARKALKKAKSLKLGIAVTAKDAAGNTGRKTASAKLKR